MLSVHESGSTPYTYNSSGYLSTVRDVRGGVTTYSYNSNGRLISAVDQRGNTVFYNTYNSAGRVISQQDARGFTTTFAWDPDTRTSTMTDARGKEWKDIYDGMVLVARVDPLGNRTKFVRDDDLNLTQIEDPRGNVTRMTYDPAGNMLTRTAPAPLSYSESWVYNAANRVTSYTDGREKTTTYEYDPAGINLMKIIQPGPTVASFTRDPTTKLVTAITNPRNKVTSFTYDPSTRNVTSVTRPSGDKTTFGYDSSGRVNSIVEPRGNVAGTDPAQYTWAYGYDAANHLTSVTDPLGNKSEWQYDAAGSLDWAKDAKLRTTDYTYYPNNLLHKVIAPDLTETVYEYDTANNLTKRTDAKLHSTVYSYDDANRLSSKVLPNGQTWSYTYDTASNLKTLVNAEGNATGSDPNDGKITYGYDELGRVKSIDYSDSTPNVSFGYDANSNLKWMTDGAGTESYDYDDLNRLKSVTRGTDVFAYEYYPDSRISRRTYPDSTVIDYTYTDDGFMDTVTSNNATTDYDYFPGGLLKKTTLPATNGYIENRVFDRAGRLAEIENTNGANVLSKFTYQLDAVGNPQTVTDKNGNITAYTYDPESDFLTEVCYQASCPGPSDPFIRYEYDEVGNRMKEIRPGGTTTYGYDESDRLQEATGPSGSVIYSHDRNDNITTAGATTYAYDLAGRMKSIVQGSTTTDYSYDGLGRRTEASVGPNDADKTRFVWDPTWELPELALERDGDGAVRRRYVHGHGPISMSAGTGANYFHRDLLGSVSNVTDESGALQWSYSYEPFGLTTATNNDPEANANPMAFTGEYQDSTGLYYLRARQYEPSIGRFVGPDPLAQPTTKAAVSSFTYVGNQPTLYVDPSGMVQVNDVSEVDYLEDPPWVSQALGYEGKVYTGTYPRCGDRAAASYYGVPCPVVHDGLTLTPTGDLTPTVSCIIGIFLILDGQRNLQQGLAVAAGSLLTPVPDDPLAGFLGMTQATMGAGGMYAGYELGKANCM